MTRSKYDGQRGRVSGKVAPGTTGEVILEINPGTNAFFAQPADGSSTYDIDSLVEVVWFVPPQTVYVRGNIQDR